MGNVTEPVCIPVPKRKCKPVTSRVCHNVPKQTCEDKCKDIYWCYYCTATYKTCSTSDDVLDTLDYSLVDETLLELSDDEKTEIDTLKKELRNGEITKKGFTNKRKKLLESPLKRFMKEKRFEDLFKGGPRDTIKSPMKVPPPAPRPGLPGSPGVPGSLSSASATGTGGSIGDINIS